MGPYHQTTTDSTYPTECTVILPPLPPAAYTCDSFLMQLIQILTFVVDPNHEKESRAKYRELVQRLNLLLDRTEIVYQESTDPTEPTVSHTYGYLLNMTGEFRPTIRVDIRYNGTHPHAFIQNLFL